MAHMHSCSSDSGLAYGRMRSPDHEPDAQAALDYYNLAFDLAQERFDLDDLDDLASFAIIALRLGESYEHRVQDGPDSLDQRMR